MNISKVKSIFKQVPLVVKYGLILCFGLILIKTLEYQLFSYRFSIELYTALIALFFLLIGIATGLGYLQSKKETNTTQNIEQLSPEEALTAKESKVLQGLTQGLSNQELADNLHVSVNTIKSHLKSVYKKLSVSNRAEAVQAAKKFDLI